MGWRSSIARPAPLPDSTGKTCQGTITAITALALWSAMHGVAALWAVTPNLPADLAHAVGDLAQEAVLTGLAA